MNRDQVVAALFADYVDFCNARGIPHDPYEVFYMSMDKYDDKLLNEAVKRPAKTQPLQPGDEQRAVAEAVRIVGGVK